MSDLNARPMTRAATFPSVRFIAIVQLLPNCVSAMHFFVEVLAENLAATGSKRADGGYTGGNRSLRFS